MCSLNMGYNFTIIYALIYLQNITRNMLHLRMIILPTILFANTLWQGNDIVAFKSLQAKTIEFRDPV